MFRRMSIATRLAAAACLFLAPFGYNLWAQIAGVTEHVAQARLELDGAAYLGGVDGVRAALTRKLVQNKAADKAADTAALAADVAALRRRYAGSIDADAAAQEVETLLAGKDRTPARIETRRALRRLAQAVNVAGGLLVDPEIATFSLGDLFAMRLADLREPVVDLHAAVAAGRTFDAAMFSGHIEAIQQAIDDDIATATGPHGVPAQKPALDAAHQPLAALVGRLVAVLESGGFDPTQAEPLLDAVDHLAATGNARFADLVVARIQRLERELLHTLLVGIGLSLLAVAVVAGLVRGGMIVPLRRMTDALRRLAQGDTTAEVPHTRYDDEIAALGAAMARFKEKLGASRALSEAVVQSTLQVSVATDQAAVAIAQISAGAHDEMASVQRLRQSFDTAQAAMKQVGLLTGTGQESSRTAGLRLSEGLADIAAMAEAVRAIAGMSQEINRVTLAIGKLAAHSNILSLNASIEASRAGEQGRGFAVVAASVGALAQQTLSLAREIEELARRSGDQIGHGLEVAAAVERRMQEVSSGIAETDRLSQAIVDEVSRQRQEFAGVEAALLDLSQISQANAAASEEISATMNGLTALTDDTRRQAEHVLAGRANRRRATLLEAEVQVAGRVETAALYDLSEDGAMMASDAPCTPGTPVTLTIRPGGVRIEAEAAACTEGFHHLHFTGGALPTATVDALALAGVARLIEATKNDHRAFVARIDDALAGRIALGAGELSTHHSCRLGRWYDSVADEVMLALPAFRALLDPHRKVHETGREVLSALAEGRTAAAQAHMAELQDLSRRILDQLDQLGAEFGRQAAA